MAIDRAPLAALMALALTGLPAQAQDTTSLAANSALLAAALSGPRLELTMRGTTVTVLASAVPAEAGCAALITAHAPGKARKWTRLFRWSETAWSGVMADRRSMIAFFEHEGRLAGDNVRFLPGDTVGFEAALARVVTACRAVHGEGERILIASKGASRSCYFARLPALELTDNPTVPPPAGDPQRGVLSLLARESPHAELQLLLERAAPDADGDDWGRPAVAFTFADPALKRTRIAAARFALDGQPVEAQHAITAYGDTRIRVGMDPFAPTPEGNFYRRLVRSKVATLTLLDRAGQSVAVLNFDAGPTLAAARAALGAADWSCASAAPAPEPAARWQPAS